MIYTTGTIAINGNTVTGTGTNFSAPLSLIRVGCTLIAVGDPVQIFAITEIKSDTELSVTPAANPAIPAGTKYSILLSDSISVDGLAQDVAETLRYYQSKETEIADALEFFRGFDLEGLKDLVNQVKQGAESAKQSANAAKTSETNSKTSETNSKTSETNAKASENAANASKNAAKTSETNAANSANKAKTEADRAEAAAGSSEAQNRVPYSGVTLPAPTGVRDMLKRLRDTVKGGFWRVDDIAQFPEDEMTPFRYGPGVCGGAGDTFFAFNVDYKSSRVKVFAGNNDAINGSSGNVGAIELAKLGANGDVAIGDGGTGASNDQEARANLQAMHERQASLNAEDLNDLKGDKAGFYYQSTSANATPERNYPSKIAGCLLVQRTGTNDPKSCIQTYTSYIDGRRWTRWVSNGATGTWSQWYEIYNSGSSPVYNGYVRATTDGRTVEMFVDGSDVGIRNRTSQTALQLRDDDNIELRTQSRNGEIFADGSSLVVRRGNGREFKYENKQTAAQDASISLWGNTTGRASVIECKLSDSYLFYAQQNTDESRVFNVNGVAQATAFNQASDRDLKDNIEEIENATESLRKMSGYTYTLKENGLPYAGVIAQEVMGALPEAVGSFTYYGEELQGPTVDGNELREETRYLNVDYAAVTGLLVQVARETDNRVTELEEENASLRDNIAAMDERIAKLEALVSKLTGSEK